MSHSIFKHQLTQDVKLLHKVAIVVDKKVLILKRSKTALSRPNLWDLPGGNSEWPVNQKINQINLHQQDLVREIAEETSISVPENYFQVDKLVYFATYFEPEKQVYSINCGWKVNLEFEDQPAVEISCEHTDFVWITLLELSQYDFGGPNRDYETAIIRQALGKPRRLLKC